VAERADDSVASGDRALHGVGARGVAEDERDAVIDLAGLRLLTYERGDLLAGRERLRDELAASGSTAAYGAAMLPIADGVPASEGPAAT
jgi:hypothetical protein